jgi:hypothetical protein
MPDVWGPAIAGVVIAWVGEGYCFLIDGLSHIAVLYPPLAMKNLLRGRAIRRATLGRNPPRAGAVSFRRRQYGGSC